MSDKDIPLPDILKEIIEEYKKMRVLRNVAKKFPEQLNYILKALDDAYEETKEMQQLQPPKNNENN